MSMEIDERILEMRFDNREFERNIHTSMESLDKLEKSLRLKEGTKGLSDVDAAAKKVDMTVLGSAVEKVHARFSALEVVAVTALANITNSAVNAGKKIASALTIDPVKSGFSEYETQINAVQTILANTKSKGTTLDDVNKALDELNAYADKTIYNFTEMTRNIGTFTAAGTDLETSVKAIQGIANLAAVSGSTSQQASTAMYQLSQALSSGTVKLMDWNSVVNAGMGGQVFQDALKETARVHGIKIDDMIEKEGSFRETLKSGWLSSEILTDTLEKFTLTTEGLTEAEIEKNREMLKSKGYTEEQIDAIFDLGKTATEAATKVKTFTQLFDTLKEAAQSGWTQTWEIIVGDFEEAKELLTRVSDVIGGMLNESSKARNEMLQGWKDLGGRKALIDAIRNAFEGILNIIKPIKDAFREIFPKTTAKQLLGLTEKLKEFTAKFKDLFKEGSETAKNLKRVFKGVFAILDVGAQIVKSIVGGFAKLLGIVAPITGDLLGFVAVIGDSFVKFRNFTKSSDIFNKAIGTIATTLGKVIKGVQRFVYNLGSALKALATMDMGAVDEFTDKLKERFKPFTDLAEGIINIFKAIGKVIKKIAPIFYGFAKAFAEAIATFGDTISDAVASAQFDSIIDILNSLLTGSLILSIKKFIKTLSTTVENAKSFVEGITNILDAVVDTFVALQTKLKADALLSIAKAIALLAASLVVLSLIDSNKLNASLKAITVLFADLAASMVAVMKYSGGKSLKALVEFKIMVNAMTTIATAVLILAFAISTIGKLDPAGVAAGVLAVIALISAMVGAVYFLSKFSGKRMTMGITGLITMAIAIRILAGAVEKLGKLDMKQLGKGLLGVGVLLAEIIVFMKLIQKNRMGLFKGLGLVLLAAAINILATAVEKFAKIDSQAMIKGLVAVGLVLAELVIFVNLTKKAKHVTATATGLVILGAAMLIFAKAIKNMGDLSWEQIGKGLFTMAAALTMVTIALKLLPKGGVLKGLTLVLLASSLLILGSVLSDMGGMTCIEMAKSLGMLAGSLIIIAAAMKFMTTAIPGALAMSILAPALVVLTMALKGLGSLSWGELLIALTALAGVFIVVGVAANLLKPVTHIILALSVAVALLGVGCMAVGAGLLMFSAGLTSLAAAGASVVVSFVAAVSAILGLIPAFIQKLAETISSIAGLISSIVEAILELITRIINAILKAIIEILPNLTEAICTVIDAIIELLLIYVPKITIVALALLHGFLEALSDATPEIVDTGADIAVKLLNGLAARTPEIVDAGCDVIEALMFGLRQNIGRLINEGTKLLIDFIDGITTSLEENGDDLRAALGDLGLAIVKGLAEGIKDGGKWVIDEIGKLCEEAWEDVKEFFGINSPSKEGIEVGKYIDEGLAIGIDKYSNLTANSATDMGETTMNSLSKALSNVSDVIDENVDANPTIRPVIDLSDVKSGTKKLSNMLDTNKSITVNSANANAHAISNGMDAGANNAIPHGSINQSPSVSFTQNNYSPKALSRLEIYRQTRNQISTMERLVKA